MGLNRRERALAAAFAQTGHVSQSAAKVGYADHTGAIKALRKPEMHAEVARIQTERLFNEVLPLAIQVHLDLLTSPTTPAGAKVQAVKLAYDRTLGSDQAAADKQPHEMTPQELQKALDDARLKAAALESVKADRARPIVESEAPEPDIFE